ncbi:CoA ester lyase [Bordetella sp. N]|uniref:HpcH/HpaI aldolase/citrate lyase family protein n=1 Tax=Bordetella sp. N TaxID=1746199 RepID=UPI00070E87F5|nr:CoA ester lyase [Bordetella sp. N]ALM86067.1 citrate lyase [Bordetella sp. N]
MALRSFLFVPGDSERKLAKGDTVGADALILDLEDSVDISRLPVARGMVREYLLAHRGAGPQLWVRINPLDSGLALADLAEIVRGAPAGIMLPKGCGARDVILLGQYLSALEARDDIPAGSIGILPVATETPQAMFALGEFRDAGPRLRALTWGGEDLAAAMGASTNRQENGEYEFTYSMARSLCLLGAHAAGVAAIDTLWANFRDADGLRRDAAHARRAGFTGKIAIHPSQVEHINAAFTPSDEELARARRIVKAFADSQGVGTLQLDGEMLDRPHLKQAQRILAMMAAE